MPPKIERGKCDGCGICIYRCGADCFDFDGQQYKARLVRGRDCVDCFICEEVCPEGAIRVFVGRIK